MKKVFISADIEGTTFTMNWDETMPGRHDYERSRQQMTNEVIAAAEGAHAAGADLVVIRDAHGPGINIYPEQLPEYTELIRGWGRDPLGMVEGIDNTFDAIFFVGYHNAAGLDGNVLSHTISGSTVQSITVNGEIASEFLIYSYTAAYYGVPSVLLTGDKELCDTGKKNYPGLVTVAVKEGTGGRSKGISPSLACKKIRSAAAEALQQDLNRAKITLPESFHIELTYKDHAKAYTKSFYPGARLLKPNCIGFDTDDWYEVNRFLTFVI
ncbi:MAG TPA: peptidase [Lachnospiraceae bacterium]|nr:peptidase [Lachnospiraceae bacterium]